ncbi:hypothetical protein HZS_3981 [Henneguya salminicola]|nr:hypothetical protein HZS_3981 [Henneguya salminicola]
MISIFLGKCHYSTHLCHCSPGWYGNSCHTAKCERYKGCPKLLRTCQLTNSKEGHECICEAGYSGLLCDKPVCQLMPCLNGNVFLIKRRGNMYTSEL